MENREREEIGTSMFTILNASFDSQISGVNTAIIGTVIGASNDRGSINVKPSVRWLDRAGDMLELPSIINVPILLPSSKRGGFLFPLASGDNVLLVFSQRGIDTWKHGKSTESDAKDYRKFHIKDCVAIPCVNPFALNMNSGEKHRWKHNSEDVLIFHNSNTGMETEIRLLSNGGIVINTDQDIEVNCNNSTVNVKKHVDVNSETAKIDVNSKAEIICPNSTWKGDIDVTGRLAVRGEVISNGVQLDSHVHAGVASGNSVSSTSY